MSASRAAGGWLIAGGAVALAAAGLMLLPAPKPRESDDPGRAVIAAYSEALLRGADVSPYLGTAAEFDDEPVSEEEAEARYADYYLRMKGLFVRGVVAGEPGGDGEIREAPGRYTLATKAQGSTPPLRIRNGAGEVEAPARLFIMNPTLVVEVREGKIHGVRTGVNRD